MPDGKVLTAKPIEFEETQSNTRQAPMLDLSIPHAQTLMDELWNCGLRPTEGAGSAGAMAAQTRHLEDMRTLVFSKPQNPTQQ